MEDDLILFTWLNDFIFCPKSIYFHNLYGSFSNLSFQETTQINGSAVHEKIDSGQYSSRKDVLSGITVFCEKYGLSGRIDIYEINTGKLIERKNKVKEIYDGYVFQLYAQYFSLKESGYDVRSITIRSLSDNQRYPIALPEEDLKMFSKFEQTIQALRFFHPEHFIQENKAKCERCIYEPLCDSSLL